MYNENLHKRQISIPLKNIKQLEKVKGYDLFIEKRKLVASGSGYGHILEKNVKQKL